MGEKVGWKFISWNYSYMRTVGCRQGLSLARSDPAFLKPGGAFVFNFDPALGRRILFDLKAEKTNKFFFCFALKLRKNK